MKVTRQLFVVILVFFITLAVVAKPATDPIPLRNWPVAFVAAEAQPSPDGMVGGMVVNSWEMVVGKSNSPHIIGNATVPSLDSRFVTVPPCRVVDTRNPTGPYGGPMLVGGGPARTFNIPGGPCTGIPATAAGYSLNFTVVNAVSPNGFLTAYPTGSTRPTVSSLNFTTNQIVGNAALVPAGTSGSIDVYTNDSTDLIIDINGYFEEGPSTNLIVYSGTVTLAAPGNIPVLFRTLGTFSKVVASTTINATWMSHVTNSTTTGGFCEFQVLIDGNPPTGTTTFFGAVIYGTDQSVSHGGRWSGLSAGTHTVALYLRGFGSNCTDNSGNFNSLVQIEEQ